MSGITLKKLSELSGLSIRTINRALKDQPDVSPEKRELVKALAEKYNYLPNIAARNFRLRRKNAVGILMRDRLLNEAHLQKVADLERELISAGRYPLLGCGRDRDPFRILREWIGLVDYVVSFRFPGAPDAAERLKDFPYTFVMVDCEIDISGVHSIALDRETGIGEAYDTLVGRGRRRIVHCGDPKLRRAAVERCAERLKGRAEFLYIPGGCEAEDGFRCGPSIMESGADAVFFDTDRMATGFYRYAWSRGIRIPDDISVAGFDDDSTSRALSPSLSTVAHPVREISRAVMEIIDSAPSGEMVRRRLSTRFIRRESIL